MQRTVILISVTLLIIARLSGQTASHVVISEVYGGGGNSGATYTNDFVELYNPTAAPVTMTSWSIQYQSAGGSGTFTLKSVFSGTIASRAFFLVQLARGSAGTVALPTPDAVGTMNLSGTSGKVALVLDSLSIANSTDPNVVDFVGYGPSANKFEGSGPTPAPGNTSSIERKASASSTAATLGPGGSEEKAGNGLDSDDNANDFVATSSINPQNSASSTEPPTGAFVGTGSAEISPSSIQADTSMTVTFTLRGDASSFITSVRVLIPRPLTWSGSSADVSLTVGGAPVLEVSKDTVKLTNLAIGQNDSLLLQLMHLSAPDTTVRVTFNIETGAGSDSSAPIHALPQLLIYGTPLPVADARGNDAIGVPVLLNQLVTIRGIVTVSSQFGGPAYVQDISGGIAVYDAVFQASVALGDEVTLSGTISQYYGLTELHDVTLLQTQSRGNDVPPLVLTAQQILSDGTDGTELYEGLLVRLNRVVVTDLTGQPITTWEVGGTQSGVNYYLSDSTGAVIVRIDRDVDVANTAAPSGVFDIVGVVSQFKPDAPFLGGYEIQPRMQADIISNGPLIIVPPYETDITPASLILNWETEKSGSSKLRYGETKAYEFGTTGDTSRVLNHAVAISNLEPATVYHVQAFSVAGADTSFASDRVVSTASLGSTGQINVYFNKSVDPSLAFPDTAEGNSDFVAHLLKRIDGAQQTIDCALYSISGTVGGKIAQALIQAHNRQVRVRMIVESDNLDGGTGTMMYGTIAPAGIPWIPDNFDYVNAGVGLHHNKFVVVDAHGSADEAWVWTGSWNLTDPGTNDDMQNVIEIQDQALAGAYTLEFNEMWGSDTDVSNASSSRFGARKLDNTPHIFTINGTHVECYFSPSDRTTSHIITTLDRADHSINIALLTFTRSDIAAALKTRRDAGVKVRAILDNNTDTGSQFNFLQSNGIEVRLDPNASALLHHKYAVIDAEQIEGRPAQWVITGSHNWTSAAENSNNENMLIIQNDQIANLYLQEFAARYEDSGGPDTIVLGIERTSDQVPRTTSLSQNYPNPFNPRTAIRFQLSAVSHVTLKVFDLLGREVADLVDEQKGPGTYTATWDARGLASGIYFYRLQAGAFVASKKMLLLK
jgi:phosphatidylserine/phosphatidylglycerophosphate/cardiolipin synthase-like enzyme